MKEVVDDREICITLVMYWVSFEIVGGVQLEQNVDIHCHHWSSTYPNYSHLPQNSGKVLSIFHPSYCYCP